MDIAECYRLVATAKESARIKYEIERIARYSDLNQRNGCTNSSCGVDGIDAYHAGGQSG